MHPPRRLRFTREGRYFVIITLGIGFAAINTGNNLLFLVLGMLLSLILVSGILSESSLRGLSVVRYLPAQVFAERPFLVGISLRNQKQRLPSFSIEVEDLMIGPSLEKRCYFLKVPAGRQQQTAYRHQFPRRGRHLLRGLRLSTRFPFSLFHKSRDVPAPAEIIVFPKMVPVIVQPPSLTIPVGDDIQPRLGRVGEYFGLRAYRSSDDPREIHWKSTARVGRPMVRELEEERAHRVTLALDSRLPADATATDAELLEEAISLAASLATQYVRLGYAVGLVTSTERMPVARGGDHLHRLLRCLALLVPAPAATPPLVLAALPDVVPVARVRSTVGGGGI